MTAQNLRDLHGPAKAGIAALILILILAACLVLDINLAALITPLIVGFAIAIVALVILIYFVAHCALRWIHIQEQLAAQKTADISDVQQGITTLKQSVDSMQKKLDRIETILEKVGE